MPLVIRRRTDDDIAELARVLVRVHEIDGYPVEGVSDPEAWLTPPGVMATWTALHDEARSRSPSRQAVSTMLRGRTHLLPDSHRFRAPGQERVRVRRYRHLCDAGSPEALVVYRHRVVKSSVVRAHDEF